MTTVNHILTQEGILTTFQIAKKVTVKDINKLREKMKSTKIDASKIREILKQSVLEEAKSSIKINHIPGIILNGQDGVDRSEEDKRIMELTYFSSLVAKKITEKKMDKYYACYIINALVNMLGLNDDDFTRFHRKFAKYKNGEPPDGEETGTTD